MNTDSRENKGVMNEDLAGKGWKKYVCLDPDGVQDVWFQVETCGMSHGQSGQSRYHL